MKEIRHIIISDPHDCCGCSGCAAVCPKGCISMQENQEGFLYPHVNEDLCIECGLCTRVCPVISRYPARRPVAVYAVKHPEDGIRDNSASGGAFPMLAAAVLKAGGCVFGSRFDGEMEAVHDCVSEVQDLLPLTGSKYIQSRMGDCFKRVKAALREGRKVLFTGTPCQIAGLNHYIGRDTDNLLTADLICHGVPSPGVWRKYLREECRRLEDTGYTGVRIDNVRFRDKENAGWKGYNFKIFFSAVDTSGKACSPVLSERGKAENLFIRGFLSDFYSRPSCYRCPAREFRSGSDMTIGDFWGIGDLLPDFDDDRGVSAVLINTEKGRKFFSSLGFIALEMSYGDVLRRNRCLEQSVAEPEKRAEFFASEDDVHSTLRRLLNRTTGR